MGLHNYFDVSSLKNVVISGPFSGASTLDRNANAEGTAARYVISYLYSKIHYCDLPTFSDVTCIYKYKYLFLRTYF